MVADGVILACATTAEARAGRRAGLATALVGLRGVNGVPEGQVVSYGLAGALDGLPRGAVLDATRVVDETGAVLWEGEPLGVRGARVGTILGASRIVDDPAERARLHDATGADAVDMESGALARSGRMAGCIRAISDTPGRRLAGVARAAKPNGEADLVGFARGFAQAPRETARAVVDAMRALRALQKVAVA